MLPAGNLTFSNPAMGLESPLTSPHFSRTKGKSVVYGWGTMEECWTMTQKTCAGADSATHLLCDLGQVPSPL